MDAATWTVVTLTAQLAGLTTVLLLLTVAQLSSSLAAAAAAAASSNLPFQLGERALERFRSVFSKVASVGDFMQPFSCRLDPVGMLVFLGQVIAVVRDMLRDGSLGMLARLGILGSDNAAPDFLRCALQFGKLAFCRLFVSATGGNLSDDVATVAIFRKVGFGLGPNLKRSIRSGDNNAGSLFAGPVGPSCDRLSNKGPARLLSKFLRCCDSLLGRNLGLFRQRSRSGLFIDGPHRAILLCIYSD
jgi:hypothetical protein